jgi:hypothetical protein
MRSGANLCVVGYGKEDAPVVAKSHGAGIRYNSVRSAIAGGQGDEGGVRVYCL